MKCVAAAEASPVQQSSRDLYNFNSRPHDTRGLIQGWFDSAWARRECKAGDSFEPFIYAWIAFNSWGNCVTGEDEDAAMIGTLARNSVLRRDFLRLLGDDSQFSTLSHRWHRKWPLFSVKHLTRAGITVQQDEYRSRKGRIAHYMQEAAKADAEIKENRVAGKSDKRTIHPKLYRPECWADHSGYHPGEKVGDNSAVPLDWPHTLHTLYAVRCNLFHGAKSRYSEADSKIVHSAFLVLVHFLRKGEYVTGAWRPPASG
jgi:hypothetical protein